MEPHKKKREGRGFFMQAKNRELRYGFIMVQMGETKAQKGGGTYLLKITKRRQNPAIIPYRALTLAGTTCDEPPI